MRYCFYYYIHWNSLKRKLSSLSVDDLIFPHLLNTVLGAMADAVGHNKDKGDLISVFQIFIYQQMLL